MGLNGGLEAVPRTGEALGDVDACSPGVLVKLSAELEEGVSLGTALFDASGQQPTPRPQVGLAELHQFLGHRRHVDARQRDGEQITGDLAYLSHPFEGPTAESGRDLLPGHIAPLAFAATELLERGFHHDLDLVAQSLQDAALGAPCAT